MNRVIEKSDRLLMETLQRGRQMSVDQLVDALGVTATAVRQRLDRLVAAGAVTRSEVRQGRGRPSFLYSLTEAGVESMGNNLTALARAMWNELLQLEDEIVRKRLMDRISQRMAEAFHGNVSGGTYAERLESLVQILRENNVVADVEIDKGTSLPVLKINGCPYPGISGPDHHQICDVEQSMFSSLLGHPVRLTECRCHSAEGSCTFSPQTEDAPLTVSETAIH